MEYLNEKKKVFARFYFASDQALLDILSNGTNPEIVDEYVGSLFDGLNHLEFVRGPGIQYPSRSAKAMISAEKEIVPFTKVFTMAGPVENYLNELEKAMIETLKDVVETSKATADAWDLDGKKRHIWLEDYCAQIALLTTQIMWTEETEKAFDDLESGGENAMKDYLVLIKKRLEELIVRVRTDLDNDLRNKIITIITIDVHERDVIEKFLIQKITDMGSF
jgi:dynein heavy chain